MNREIKKRQLRRQIVPSPAPQEEDSEEIVRKARKRVKLKRLRIFLIIGVILIAVGIGLFQYFRRVGKRDEGRQFRGLYGFWRKRLEIQQGWRFLHR